MAHLFPYKLSYTWIIFELEFGHLATSRAPSTHRCPEYPERHQTQIIRVIATTEDYSDLQKHGNKYGVILRE